MKIKSLVMMTIATLVFAACSNDDVLPEGGSGVDEAGEAWVSMNVRFPAAARAAHNPEQENATTDESKITTLTALFFDGFESTSTVTNVVDLLGGSYTETSGAAKAAFKVSKNAKSILIVANAPSAFNPAVGQTFATVNAVRTETADDLSTAGKFMMTNAKGDLEPSDDNGFGKALTLHATETAAMNTPLTVRIDRVVSKVRLYTKDNLSANATIGEVKWVLNVTNKKYYPVSQRTKTYLELNGGTWTTNDQYRLGSYRIDPNYDNNANPYTKGGSDAQNANYIANYNYYKDATASIAWKDLSSAEGDADDPQTDPNDGNEKKNHQYCLENTQVEADNNLAYTTQALVKTTYIPKSYKLSPTASSAASKETTTVQETNNDWIMIDRGYYTYSTLVDWIGDELTAYYTNNTEHVLLTTFKSYLASFNPSLDNISIPAKDDNSKNVAEKVEEVKNALTALKATVAAKTDRAKTVGNLSYYAGGLSYYIIPVKHNDDGNVSNKLGEFGCVRNSVYDIHISKIHNPGYPVIPEPDVDVPDEQDYYLAVEIVTNPWTWYTQTEEL